LPTLPPLPVMPGSWHASVGENFELEQTGLRIEYQSDGPLSSISSTTTNPGVLTPLTDPAVRLTLGAGSTQKTIDYPASELVLQPRFSSPEGGAALTGTVDGTELWIAGRGALSYMRYGYWASRAPGFASPTTLGLFHTGKQTPLSEIPASGTATYRGQTIGIAQAGPQDIRFSAPITLNADFSARSISGSIGPLDGVAIRRPDILVSSVLPGIDLAGTIVANRFSGAASASGGGTPASGTFDGTFYGPGAAEVGGAWNIASPGNTIRASGTFGAKR
jgi:hypothetical protein